MGDDRGVSLPAVNRLQDRDHQVWRFEAAQVDMNCVPQSSAVGLFGCASAHHDDVPHL